MRFHEIKEMLKISDFYLGKQKSFIPKKILSVPYTMNNYFPANRWPLDVLTFLIHDFDIPISFLRAILRLHTLLFLDTMLLLVVYRPSCVFFNQFFSNSLKALLDYIIADNYTLIEIILRIPAS